MIFKDQTEVSPNSKSEPNIMSLIFVSQLDLKVQQTNIKVQKIDGTTLKIYGIVVFTFSVLDKDSKKRFFEESLFLANDKPGIVLGMLFLTMSNVNIEFQAQDLQ